MELKTVRLYGHLGKKFGKEFKLAVSSPAEAINALSNILDGFKTYLKEHSEPGYHIFIGKLDLSEEEIAFNHSSDIIKIVPATVGSGGIFKVILGAILIIASTYLGPVGAFAMKAGIGLVLSGISEILFAPPKPGKNNTEKPENTPSYIYNGGVNTTGMGNPVPVCYGRLRVGSQVVSAGLTSKEIPISGESNARRK